ncbi:killer cell lectin-like receptor subfamily G member 2 [Oryctolagus cuniculus]|uniref:killer cell lectin-like receptor subfamily G member 2 n=1 Tax=Oryctolagus cuniculus TaxID=9986 RepID=UPI0038792AD1
MEPLGSEGPELERPQGPGEKRLGSPESSPSLARAGREAAGSGRDLSDDTKLPPPRPGPLRMPPLSLGYGAFRRLGSAGREPPSPSAASAEQPRAGEASGSELAPWAAPGESPPGTWAPVELQVDVRLKPMGGSRAPSPAPSTRFLTVPVPESPAVSRQTEPGCDAEGRASPAAGRAGSPGSPTGRCAEPGPGPAEDAVRLLGAGTDGRRLPRAIALIGLPTYMKSLQWALAVMAVLLAFSTVAIVVLASRAGARCQPCPQGWLWTQEHCYYLSAEPQAWEPSQAFCSAHRATLPLLRHTQDFLSRQPITTHSWLGARRGPQGWHWMDGVPLPPPLLPEEDEDDPALSCGVLEAGRLVAVNCSSRRPWVCARGAQ